MYPEYVEKLKGMAPMRKPQASAATGAGGKR
jgi:hypothetical protein